MTKPYTIRGEKMKYSVEIVTVFRHRGDKVLFI